MMTKHYCSLFIFIFCFFFVGSQAAQDETKIILQEIKGRNKSVKKSLYRVKTPSSWIRRDPLPNEDLSDTTKAIVEFIIKDNEHLIRIAIHSFPTEDIKERIKAEAQVARWKRQFNSLIPSDYLVTPYSANGYLGLFFNGKGIQENKPVQVIALSLLLAPLHYQTLSISDESELEIHKEMRADITIKAVGHPEAFITQEDAIMRFTKSFELIEEIPFRS